MSEEQQSEETEETDLIVEPEDRKSNKIKINKGFTTAIETDAMGEKTFLAKVGDIVLLEYRKDSWRDDTYYRVDRIEWDSGDVHLFNLKYQNHGATNFKRAEAYGHYIWFPPENKMPGFRKLRAPTQKKKKK